MNNLQGRPRCALQRNNRVVAPCRDDVVTGARFKDHRGALVTVVSRTRRDVIYLRDGYHSDSCLPLNLFAKKFLKVES